MIWLHYLVEANIYLGVFYLCYCLFLTRDTHYTLGRFYLLFSCVIAFILPFTQISILKPVEPAVQEIQIEPLPANAVAAVPFGLADILFYAYVIGGIITLMVLIHRFYRLFRLSQGRDKEYIGNYKLIRLEEDNTAFSFFNNLYIGNGIVQSQTVIAHELVHIRQKHSWDILFIEIVKIVSWFNPFIYLLQNSLRTLHEYIADEQAAKEQDALTYSSFLLNNAYGIQGSSIAHSFFNYNLLKKRIIMLNQKRSGRLARLKYLAVIPLCGGMLCTSTLVFSKDYGFIDLAPKHRLAAVINAPYQLKLNATADTIKKKKVTRSTKAKTKVIPDVAEIEIVPPPPAPKSSGDLYEIRVDRVSTKRSKHPKKGEKMYMISDIKEIQIETPPPPANPGDVKVTEVKTPPPPPPPAISADVTKIRLSAPAVQPAKTKKTNGVEVKLAVPKVLEKDSLKVN